MNGTWAPGPQFGGGVLQAGLRKHSADRTQKAHGLLVRGVVVATYVEEEGQTGTVAGTAGGPPPGVYCDVLPYGRAQTVIPRCMVAQTGGLHEGEIWKPRAARLDLVLGVVDVDRASSPADLDGDHVIVGFADDDLALPVIVGRIPHPRADVGNEGRDLGQRMTLTVADGEPRLWKHRGAAFGLDTRGNWTIDTRRAHGGTYQPDGAEPEPPGDGAHGNVDLKLPRGTRVNIEIEGGATLRLEDRDGNARLTLGDGAVSVAVADHLEALYGQLKQAFDFHTHITTATEGPSAKVGTIAPPATPAPAWDSRINSDKARIPD